MRVHPDPHRILAGTHDRDVSDTGKPGQLVDQIDRRVIPHEQRVARFVRRIEGDEQQDRRRFGADCDPLRLRRLRQLGHRVLHPVLHQHLVHVRVAADVEAHRQHIGAVIGAGRLHVDHARDAIYLQLDRQGDGVDDGLRAGSRIAGRDLHGRRRDVGILGDRQAQHRDGADQHQHDRQDVGEDRMLDKELRDHCCDPAPVVPATASMVVGFGVTLVPGVARHKSPTTIRSSGVRPEVTTRSPPINEPSLT